MATLHDYAGAIHLHSAYSHDGRIPARKIIEAARKREIDFIMLTDHMSLRAREDGLEGWHGKTLLIVGQEIAPRFNHYLAFGLDEAVMIPEDDIATPPQVYIDAVNAMGGIGFIAHPDHKGAKLFHVKHYPWLDWSAKGYTGMGIWDFMTDWQSSLTGRLRSLGSYVCPAFFLNGPREETLKRWDLLNEVSPIVGIGELDNHATIRRVFGVNFSVFPFRKALQFVRTHVLLNAPLMGDGKADIASLLDALRRGRAYVSQEYFRPARGFSYTVSDGSAATTMGDEFILKGEASLNVDLPAPAQIRLVKNGLLFHEAIGKSLSLQIHREGIFRVEACLSVFGKYRPWIFSNPIYVRKPATI